MDVELVPWETAKIGIYKDMLKYTDIHIRVGTVVCPHHGVEPLSPACIMT